MGMCGEELQFFIEYFQALLRDIVGLDVIDADLQVIQAGLIESFDAVNRQQISVGDQRRQDAVASNAVDDLIEIGMEQRLTTADCNRCCAKFSKSIDSPEHLIRRDRL